MIRLFQPDLWMTASDDNCICSVTADDNQVFLHSYKLNKKANPCLIWHCEDVFPNEYCHYKKRTNFKKNPAVLDFTCNARPFKIIGVINGEEVDLSSKTTVIYDRFQVKLDVINVEQIKIVFDDNCPDTINVVIHNEDFLGEHNINRDGISIGECLNLNTFRNYTPQRLCRDLQKLGFNSKCSFKLDQSCFNLILENDVKYCETPVTLNRPVEKWLRNIKSEMFKIFVSKFIIEASNNLHLKTNMQKFDIDKNTFLTSDLYHDNQFLDYNYIEQLNDIFDVGYYFCYNFYYDKYYDGDKYTLYYPVIESDFNTTTEKYDRLWSDENAYNNSISERIMELVDNYYQALKDEVFAGKLSDNVYFSTKIDVRNSFFDQTRNAELVDKKNYSMFNFENNCYDDCKLYVEFPSKDVLGVVTVYIDNQSFQADVVNGVAAIKLSGVNGGVHKATISFKSRDESKYYSRKWTNVAIQITQTNNYTPYIVPLICLTHEMKVNVVNEDIKNSLVLTVNGESYVGKQEGNIVTFTIPELKQLEDKGTYLVVNLSYDIINERVILTINDETFIGTVVEDDIIFDTPASLGDYEEVKVRINDAGVIILYLDGEAYPGDLEEDGSNTIVIPEPKQYKCKLHYSGDSVYDEIIFEKSLNYIDDSVKIYSDLILNKRDDEAISNVYHIDACTIPIKQIANTGLVSDVFFYIDDVDDYYKTGDFLYNCRALLNQSVSHSHGIFNIIKEKWDIYKSLFKISGNNLNFKLINNFDDFLDWNLVIQDFIVPLGYYIHGDNIYFHYAGDDNVVYETKKNLIVKEKGVIVENPQIGIPAYIVGVGAFGSELLCGNVIDNIFTALQMAGVDETILIVDFDGVENVSDQFCEAYYKFLLNTKSKVITLNMDIDVSNIFASFIYDSIEVQELSE